MGNCLVTKLKENVSNPNIFKIGEIKFTASDFIVRCGELDSFTATILSDNTFTGGNTTYTGNSLDKNMLTEQKPTTISVVSKYKITHFVVRESPINVDQLQYCSSLLSLTISSNSDNLNVVVTGDLAKVLNTAPIVNINFRYAKLSSYTLDSIFTKELPTVNDCIVSGLYNKITHKPNELSALATLTSALAINVWDSGFRGSYEDFVLKSRQLYNKNTGSVVMRNNSSETMFHGAAAEKSWDINSLIWAPNSINPDNTDITWGSITETIDANGNIIS